MAPWLLGLTLILAMLNWWAVYRQVRWLEYVAKPGVMIALLAWLGVAAGFQGSLLWFGLGLIFSLGGDIALMLPKEQFILGLISFFLAHVAYLIGFNDTLPPLYVPGVILAIIVLISGINLYRRIAAGLEAGGNAKLKPAVLAYAVVISLMLLSALLTLTRPEWQPLPALMVSAGALLFYISDSVLAYNKFVQPVQYARLIIMVTYHLGQILIITGAAVHFG
jgi:uncharacterized membrane protein YhhN